MQTRLIVAQSVTYAVSACAVDTYSVFVSLNYLYSCEPSLTLGAIELSILSESYETELHVVDIQTNRIDKFGRCGVMLFIII